MSTTDAPLGPMAPRCATHPEETASGTCSRCGTFFCPRCVRTFFGKDWCSACALRPELHYLERFREKLWGRRDFSAWLVGVGGIAFAAMAILGLWEHVAWQQVLAAGSCAVAGVAFFLGMRWAREALIVAPLMGAGLMGTTRLKALAALLAIMSLVAVSIYFDTRNRLFFKREVSPERLQRLWHQRENNPRARDALSLSLGGLFFPPFAVLAVLFGVAGLRRVDPHASPPIGRKGQAILGIALGSLMLVVWSLVLWQAYGWFFVPVDD